MYLINAAGYSNFVLFLVTQTLHYAFKSARGIYVASWYDSNVFQVQRSLDKLEIHDNNTVNNNKMQ